MRGGVAKGMLMELDLKSQSQRYWGLDEREIFDHIQRLSSGCKSLVDVGANDGYYTMAFLRSTAERVVACEPGPSAELLLRNASANHHELNNRFSVVSSPIGLGSGFISVTDLLKGLPRPIFLKVDIEGGEVDLLRSAEGFAFIDGTRWLVETHSAELEQQCIGWFHARGLRTQIIRKARWRVMLPEQRPLIHNRWLVATPEALGARTSK
jgi:hypothetical protein